MVVHGRFPLLFKAQAITVAPRLIVMVPARRDDAALLAHEQVHASQQREHGWRRGGFVGWWVCYLASRAFRQRMEVAAYRVQIQHGASLEDCARNLSTRYCLGITMRTARMLLS